MMLDNFAGRLPLFHSAATKAYATISKRQPIFTADSEIAAIDPWAKP